MPEIFQIRDKDLMARIGYVETKSGRLETPAFFPVIDPVEQVGEGALLPPKEIWETGFKAIMTNAYTIKRRYGARAVEKGVRGLLGFPGIVATDSGAYQHLVYGSVRVGNREIVEYQNALGSDIAVILDIPTREGASREEALASVEETLRRAREVLDIVASSKTLWMLPIQGGEHLDLVRRSASEAKSLEGYSIYGVGSPVTFLQNYSYSKIVDMILAAKEGLPPDAPVHLFGAGHPMMIPFAIALGVDTFDSASYILYAKDGRYLTEYGTERLEDLEVFPCSCPVCSRRSPRDLLDMSPRERISLLAMHNLYSIERELRRVRTYIREGRLWDLLAERSRSHPALFDAFKRILRISEKLERVSPYSKGRRGLLLTGPEDLLKPQVLRTRALLRRYLENLLARISEEPVILVPGDSSSKPFSSSREYGELLNILDSRGARILFYTPYLGIVPEELEETYPFSQHEAPSDPAEEVVKDLEEEVLKIIDKLEQKGPKIMVVGFKRLGWSLRVLEAVGSRRGVERVVLS